LADFGTRLKAVFANVPANVSLFVSTTNIVSGAAATVGGGGIGSNASATYAELINATSTTDNVSDGATGPPVIASGTVTAADGNTAFKVIAGGTSVGTGQAVWEVTNTQGAVTDTLTFNVYASYTGTVPSPTTTTNYPSVTLGFAPTYATTNTVIPQFVAPSVGPAKIFDLTTCRTILLFPYVTTGAFDTGLAISNTSLDPLVGPTGSASTPPQSGTCTLNWYPTGVQTATTTQAGTAITPTVTVTIAPGTTWAADASTYAPLSPGFQGYMIAVCGFQYAHGFAFISQADSPYNGTMGYLALVVPDPGTGTRPAGPQPTNSTGGETLEN